MNKNGVKNQSYLFSYIFVYKKGNNFRETKTADGRSPAMALPISTISLPAFPVSTPFYIFYFTL